MRNHIKTVTAKAVQFAEVTKGFIRLGDTTKAKKCLDIAELLFATGSNETKNAIANIYLSSVSTFMELRNGRVSAFFPPTLRQEYITQINASGV